MRILITGGGGHIGSFVISELLAGGHEAVALARSEHSADVARSLGAAVRRGEAGDVEAIPGLVDDVDAVVHLAFDNAAAATGDMAGATARDLAIVRAYGDALAGTGKAFVGVGVGPTGDEAVDATIRQNPRYVVPQEISRFPEREIRSILVAVPPVVHSERDEIGFLPTLIRLAREAGSSGYVEDGGNHWPAVHTADLARLFRLALERAPAGAQLYGAAQDDVTTRAIAERIALRLGLPAVSVRRDDVEAHFGGFGMIMGLDFPPLTSAETRAALGWTPTGPGVLEDLDEGRYFDRH